MNTSDPEFCSTVLSRSAEPALGRRPLLFALLLVAVTLAGVAGVQASSRSSHLVFTDRFEAWQETQIQVWVTDTVGVSLAGVTLRADGVSGEALTDAEGRAIVAAPAIDGAVLRLEREGYLPQWRRLDLSTGANASTPLRIGMVPRSPVQGFDAADAVTLSGADGAQVVLPANSFVDENGQPVSGEIEAYVTALDVSDPDGLAAFPGSFEAIGAGDEPGSLLTYGLVDFRFEQNGEALTLADGLTALIDVPIYLPDALDGVPLQPGDTIPLWSLDESDGVWRAEGDAEVVASAASPTGLVLQGNAAHFSWWNADIFVLVRSGPDFLPRTAYLRPRLHCNAVGEACPSDRVEGAWLNFEIAEPGLPRVGSSRWVPAGGEPPLVPIPAGFELALEASVADGYLAVAELAPNPLIAEQADEIVDVDIVLRPRHLVDDGWFIPGERLRGRMETIGETHRYRFAGRAGLVFRLRGYAAATSTAGPDISADLGGRVQVLRGDEVLAESIFDESTIAEIDLPLPADDEYQVHFIAEGKVPGFYVATTALNLPSSASAGEVLFVARDFSGSAGDYGVYTVDALGSYVELSQPMLQGCVGPRMGNGVSGTCNPSSLLNGTGEPLNIRSDWLPAFARELEPGRIAYLSETDQPGFSGLYTVETSSPGLALELSGPEIGGAEGFRVVDYRNGPALPGRIVYKVAGSEAPTEGASVNVLGSPGRLYAVDMAQPEQRRLLPMPSPQDWVMSWELAASGRHLVFETRVVPDGEPSSPGHLYFVDLDNPSAAARRVSDFDPAAGDQVQRFAVSPDGRWLAYSARLAGTSVRYEGYLVDLDDPDATPIPITLPVFPRVRELRFAPDSRSLVLRHATSSSMPDSAGELYRVDLTDPDGASSPVRLGDSSFRGSIIRPERWRIAPTADRVVAWSQGNLREVRFDAPLTSSLRLALPVGGNLGPHVYYAADGQTLLLRFKPDALEPWGLLRQAPDAASTEFEVLIGADDYSFVTNGVLQFAPSASGSSVLAVVDVDNASRHAILQVSLDAEPVVATLVPPEDGPRSLLLTQSASSPWFSFGVLSE